MGKKNKQRPSAPTPATHDTEADKSKALDAALELDAVADKVPDAPEAPAAAKPIPKKAEPKKSAERKKDETVKGKDGKPMFTRKAPTLDEQGRKPIAKVKPKIKPKTKTTRNRMPEYSKDGTHVNPRYLKFPADKWGVTKDLKAALVRTASRIAGDDRKMELVKETLRIGLTHMDMKYKRDKVYKDARQKEADSVKAEDAE